VRFVDTNVLLYRISEDSNDVRKRRIAEDVLAGGDLALSAQVLQEFYYQVTRNSRSGSLTPGEALRLVIAFSRFPVEPITQDLVFAAIATHERYQISYWDAAIIEAARLAGCDEVLSEDPADGQEYAGVRVVNPFA